MAITRDSISVIVVPATGIDMSATYEAVIVKPLTCDEFITDLAFTVDCDLALFSITTTCDDLRYGWHDLTIRNKADLSVFATLKVFVN